MLQNQMWIAGGWGNNGANRRQAFGFLFIIEISCAVDITLSILKQFKAR